MIELLCSRPMKCCSMHRSNLELSNRCLLHELGLLSFLREYGHLEMQRDVP